MADLDGWRRELTDLGLTGYEARVYLALVNRSRYTAAQIARESGVPRQRVYDVLSGLTERGLVRALPGQVARFTAVDPASAIERLMATHRATFSHLEQTTARLVEALVPAWSQGRDETDPLDYVEVLRDREMLSERIEEIQAEAEREILAMAKLPYLTGTSESGIATIHRLNEAGGSVRCLYERDTMDHGEMLADIRRYAAAGEHARIAASVPMRMWIVDGSRVVMSLRDPVAESASTTNVFIEHPALAQCLAYAFEAIWDGAEPVT
ncbi:helix-turn-helix domain-containing protein [Actinomadura sp. DC4]|uniref:TrmB family transcriptional regulator n=1 Tax=Actinomadura sp. DC4 TaxID=3055069 RepID=UPI0025B0AEDD|nr:helix-turn-helix domain-containing protein [Actinomadura sp. DC4]MDN3352398.1 helix-turn-helix domain-containing protein [Actinomadura sp. DC4]